MSGRQGAASAALDVLLTDAALGNPAQRLVRAPAPALAAAASVVRRPDLIARHGGGLAAEVARVLRGTSQVAPAKQDRRFSDPAWHDSWYFRRLMQTYLAAGSQLDALIDELDLEWRLDRLTRFAAGNIHDLLSPSNFAWSNPAVIKQTIDQGGANLVKGVRRAVRDVGARRLPAMVDTSKFEVGGNLAVTDGAVVLRTEVFELIQYRPRTSQVYEVPLLIVPPTINRYYILDLAPGRSFVEYMLDQGLQVFVMSWRNPGEAQGHFDLDTYALAVLEAREAVSDLTRQERVHLNAVCSGGLITAGAAAHLHHDGREEGIATLTVTVCALDSRKAGTTLAIATRELAAAAVAESARKGYLDGSALNSTFAWLRPNDLIWGYVVNNYLMGKPPPAFDILYWNQDAVRLAAGLHRDFVHMALDNSMMQPGRLRVLDAPVDLSRLRLDSYVIAGLKDHIVPWENVYRGSARLGGPVRFVLAGSGHVQTLVSPPGPESRASYRVADEPPEDESLFLNEAPMTSGSWWPDYVRWLGKRSGAQKRRRPTPGNSRYPATARAPGTYVHAA